MIRYAFVLMILINSSFAETLFTDNGFHWYGKEPIEQFNRTQNSEHQSSTSSYYERLMHLREETKEALAKALLEPTVESTANYMRKQQHFLQINQDFIKNWEKALLLHPELDYKLKHPVDNSALILRNEEQAKLIDDVIRKASKEYGFIIFYRGNSPISQKFIPLLIGFVSTYHIEMITVSTDNTCLPQLPKTVLISQKELQEKLKIKARYVPAVFLVHLKSKKIQPLSYGFLAYEDFKKRFFDVITHFKRFSEEGVL